MLGYFFGWFGFGFVVGFFSLRPCSGLRAPCEEKRVISDVRELGQHTDRLHTLPVPSSRTRGRPVTSRSFRSSCRQKFFPNQRVLGFVAFIWELN